MLSMASDESKDAYIQRMYLRSDHTWVVTGVSRRLNMVIKWTTRAEHRMWYTLTRWNGREDSTQRTILVDAGNGSIDCRETRHHFVAEFVGVDGTGERDDSPTLPSVDHNNLKLGTVDVHFPETS